MIFLLRLLIAEIDPGYTESAKTTASNFYPPNIVISKTNSTEINVIEAEFSNEFCGGHVPIVSDNNDSTCIPVTRAHKQLQAIFTFPSLPPTHELSVRIILMNVNGCSSPAWTWFTESDCHRGIYTECSHTLMVQTNELTHCTYTCHCFGSCDSLYLKYNNIPLRNQTSEQLCEIWARWDVIWWLHDKANKFTWSYPVLLIFVVLRLSSRRQLNISHSLLKRKTHSTHHIMELALLRNAGDESLMKWI